MVFVLNDNNPMGALLCCVMRRIHAEALKDLKVLSGKLQCDYLNIDAVFTISKVYFDNTTEMIFV